MRLIKIILNTIKYFVWQILMWIDSKKWKNLKMPIFDEKDDG